MIPPLLSLMIIPYRVPLASLIAASGLILTALCASGFHVFALLASACIGVFQFDLLIFDEDRHYFVMTIHGLYYGMFVYQDVYCVPDIPEKYEENAHSLIQYSR